MKLTTLMIALLTIALNGYSQMAVEEIDLIQAAFGMEKKAIVASFVSVDDSHKEPFWTLYDEYESKRKELGKKRIALLDRYAKEYNTMTAEQADAFTKEVIALSTANDKLIVTYYNKVKKISNALVATQFFQIEEYILTAIRMEVLEGIPFVGEK